MDIRESFEQSVRQVLAKYKDTPLVARWEEAISFGDKTKALAFWIRDFEDVINIVWLCRDGIRDITWSPSSKESMFNFVPLKSILTFEIHDKENIGKQLLGVVGNYVVKVVLTGTHGNIWWVAENEESEQRLHTFLTSVLKDYAKAKR